MLTIEKVDTTNKAQVREFTHFPFHLYKNHPQWVPPLLIDSETQLNRNKHPYYQHSDADFFLAKRNGEVVGRIAALENKRFNEYHQKRDAEFYLFDTIDDQEVADKLFSCVFDWAKERGLNAVVGPKGFGVLDGYGLLVEGYEHRQMMNMMNYNYPYYVRLVENLGFRKEVDFVSCYVKKSQFVLDERIHRIADRLQQRGTFRVLRFTKKSELKAWANRIGQTYNNTFVNNWEYYPLTQAEIDFLLQNLLTVANPRLIKIIAKENDVVGFLFGFPDVSAAMQRAQGKLLPFGLIDMLLEMRRTNWVAVNGAGMLPQYQGVGGNALLYSEMEKTIRQAQFEHADMTQVAETAVQMRRDLINLGGKPYKNHRVFHKDI
jgi:hypothetical protein